VCLAARVERVGMAEGGTNYQKEVKREVERESPVFLTVEEAAGLLRLKRSHAYDLVKKGVIPSIRLGRFIRVPKEPLMRMGFPKEYEAGGAKG